MKIYIRAAVLFCIFAVLLLCGCDTAGYTEKNLQTTNGEDGWICTFDALNGEYTNGFPINSSHIRITTRVESGYMDVVLSANGVTEVYDGTDMDESIPVEQFGDGNLYITFDAKKAEGGKIRVIWERDDDE